MEVWELKLYFHPSAGGLKKENPARCREKYIGNSSVVVYPNPKKLACYTVAEELLASSAYYIVSIVCKLLSTW